jgi:hypothetical protein
MPFELTQRQTVVHSDQDQRAGIQDSDCLTLDLAFCEYAPSQFAFSFLKLNRDFQYFLIRFLKRTLHRLNLMFEIQSPLKLKFETKPLRRRLPQGRIRRPCARTHLLVQGA